MSDKNYIVVSAAALIEPTGIQTKPNQLVVNPSPRKTLFHKIGAAACR